MSYAEAISISKIKTGYLIKHGPQHSYPETQSAFSDWDSVVEFVKSNELKEVVPDYAETPKSSTL